MSEASTGGCEFCGAEAETAMWGHLLCEVHEHEIRKLDAREEQTGSPVLRYMDERRRRRDQVPRCDDVGLLLREELDRWHELDASGQPLSA
jgi:hypothetical protein